MLIKKCISLLISGVLVLSTLAGCGSGSSSDAPKKTDTPVTEAKPVTLKFSKLYHSNLEIMAKEGIDPNNNRITQAHNKNSGVTVQWDFQPKTDVETKIAMMFAGGDMPDMINLSRDSAFKYAAQGAIITVDELIAKYCPEYLKISMKEVLDVVKVNGKSIAFAMSEIQSTQVPVSGIIVRRDIMEELGLKDPKTLEEFVTLLKTIKEKKNIIPLETNNVLMTSLQGAFGIAGRTVEKNGKLEFSYVQPEFKEYLEFMKKLYDEGLIDKEFSLVKDLSEKVVAGRAFAAVGDWAFISLNKVNLAQKIPGAKLDFIPFPEGKNGKKGSVQNTIFKPLVCIPANAKEKDAAAKFINYMCTEQAGRIQDHGIEGVDYKLADGKVVQTLEEQTKVTWKICYQTMARQESGPIRMKMKGFDPEFNRLVEVSKGLIIAEPTLVAPPIEKFDKALPDLDKHVTEFATKVVMGAVPISDFDKYVQGFIAKGGKDAIDAMNEWYKTKAK